MSKRKNFAFIVELFLLFALMLLVTVVLTRAFVTSRTQSLYAKHKTEAVILAERVAEISMASEDWEKACRLIEEMDEVRSFRSDSSGASFTAKVNSEDPVGAEYEIVVDWDAQDGKTGSMNSKTIYLYYGDAEDPIYVLSSGTFRKEGGNGK